MFDNQKKSKSLTPIVVSNLSLLLGKTKILDKIKCKIHNESIVAVLGPNGAGKSMFLKTINGLIGVESQKINFNSIEINDYIRKEIAMVFQKTTLLRRSVFENMQFVLEKKNKLSNLEIMKLLQRVSLDTFKDKPARLLSGGEQQRACVARAMIKDPDILLADEPTGNLDPVTSFELIKIFEKINKAGTTILMASHNYNLIKGRGHRIIEIQNGSVRS